MNVIQTPDVDIVIRSLREEDRRQIWPWFDHLRNWENDSFARKHSEKLPSFPDVYVLKTSKDGWRIVFSLSQIKSRFSISPARRQSCSSGK